VGEGCGATFIVGGFDHFVDIEGIADAATGTQKYAELVH
jgi:hypothetical protein